MSLALFDGNVRYTMKKQVISNHYMTMAEGNVCYNEICNNFRYPRKP